MSEEPRKNSRREILGGLAPLPFLLSCGDAAGRMVDRRVIDPATAPDWEKDPSAGDYFGWNAIHVNNEGMSVANGGRTIIYARQSAPCNELELIDTAARTIQRLFHPNRLLKLRDPALSLDGTSVLLAIAPPLYRGVSNLIEVDLRSLLAKRLATHETAFYHSPSFASAGVVFGVNESPVETPDGRAIANPAYREGFFSHLGRIADGEETVLSPSVVFADLNGLSVGGGDRPIFRTSGWILREGKYPPFGSVESRFPDYALSRAPLLFTLTEAGLPEFAVRPERLAAFLMEDPNNNRRSVRFRGALRSGEIFYTTHGDDFLVQVIIDDGRRFSVMKAISAGVNAHVGLGLDGSVAVVNGNETLPAVAAIDRSGSTTHIQQGLLARLPDQRISYAYLRPGGS